MTIYRGYGGVNRTVKEQYRCLSGVNRTVKEQYRGYGGVNRKVFSNWNGVLYDSGNEYTGVTGGWKAGYYAGYLTSQTKTAAYLECHSEDSSGKRSYQTTNAIDITNYNTINFDVMYSNGHYGYVAGFLTDMSIYTGAPILASTLGHMPDERFIVSIDVSSLNGSYYFAVFTASTGINTTRLYKCWLT